jgi:hypothetical protein
MTWFLTGTAVALWLFRKRLARMLTPYLPDRQSRHRVLSFIIIAFAITATVRLVARYMPV